MVGRSVGELTAAHGIPDDAGFFRVGEGLTGLRQALAEDFPPTHHESAAIEVLAYTWRYEGYAARVWLVKRGEDWVAVRGVAWREGADYEVDPPHEDAR